MGIMDTLSNVGSKAVSFVGRGVVHVGGGAGKGALTGAKWGLIASALIGIAATVAFAMAVPAIMGGVGMLLYGAGTAGAAAFAATFSTSLVGALGAGALISIPAAMIIQAPHPVVKGLGVALAVAAAPALWAIGGAAGGLTLIAGAIGAATFGTTAIVNAKYGAYVGGALGAIGRIFSFPTKEAERATVIEQNKIVDAQQQNTQALQYEAAAQEKLTAMQQKAASYQMENPLAKGGNAQKVIENRTAQPEQNIGSAVGVGA